MHIKYINFNSRPAVGAKKLGRTTKKLIISYSTTATLSQQQTTKRRYRGMKKKKKIIVCCLLISMATYCIVWESFATTKMSAAANIHTHTHTRANVTFDWMNTHNIGHIIQKDDDVVDIIIYSRMIDTQNNSSESRAVSFFCLQRRHSISSSSFFY